LGALLVQKRGPMDAHREQNVLIERLVPFLRAERRRWAQG
jgi:hypothetical protein